MERAGVLPYVLLSSFPDAWTFFDFGRSQRAIPLPAKEYNPILSGFSYFLSTLR